MYYVVYISNEGSIKSLNHTIDVYIVEFIYIPLACKSERLLACYFSTDYWFSVIFKLKCFIIVCFKKYLCTFEVE